MDRKGVLRIDELKGVVKGFPRSPGVYLMKSVRGTIIYVGKAKDLRARVRSYLTQSKDISVKTQFLVSHIHTIEYLLTNTEVEAFLLEASLIKKHKPRYNIRLKDDKSYPYLRCSRSDEFPRFYLSRKVARDGSLYFGPYTSGHSVRESIKFINQTFQIRDCSDAYMKGRERPCMTHQIGRCTAPCVDLVTVDEYGFDIDAALEFLRGQDQKVINRLNKTMKRAAKDERFEAAAKLRDSIYAIEAIFEKQSVISPSQDIDQDVIAYFGDERGTLIETVHMRKGRMIGSRPHYISKLNCEGEGEDPKEWMTSFLNQYYMDNILPQEILITTDLGSDLYRLLSDVFKERFGPGAEVRFVHTFDEVEKKLVEIAYNNAKSHFNSFVSKQESRNSALTLIQKKLKLPKLPERIECYDISNFQGDQSVASQVVFENGTPKRDDYRRYKIMSVEGPNDFASMKEVLTRRFNHKEYEDPQLIVVDGGKGQLRMAVEVLKEMKRLDIPVVGLAKAKVKGEFYDSEVEGTEERFFIPGQQNPITFGKTSEALQILVGLRDEAHRFAITYHRKLRDEVTLSSELDFITGLGEKRKKILLKKFESIDAIRVASIDEIAELSSFNRLLAERVLLQLNEKQTAN
ncbi:excinuclease ABC subunit UvrC [Bdellovibrionales bacterium]|nr:excinuclease ABC subunit UvrC [Bdellovibrionales bacterium]